MQYILRDPRGACQVDWIQDTCPTPRNSLSCPFASSRPVQVNYFSDLTNRFKGGRLWISHDMRCRHNRIIVRITFEFRATLTLRGQLKRFQPYFDANCVVVEFYYPNCISASVLILDTGRPSRASVFPSILAFAWKCTTRGGRGEDWRDLALASPRRTSGGICLSKAEKPIFWPKSCICS